MANGQFVADIPGAINRGQQFAQQERLRPLQQQQAQLGIQSQQQQFALGQQREQIQQQQIQDNEKAQLQKDFVISARQLQDTPDKGKLSFLLRRRQEISSRGGDTSDTDIAIGLAQDGNFTDLNNATKDAVNFGRELGLLKSIGGEAQKPSGQREFEALTKGLTDEQKQEAVLIELGINPRAVSSGDITIAKSPELTEQVASSKSIIKQREKFAELTGSSRAKTIDKGFEKIAKISAGIGNIDRAISALNSGAGVGAIEKFLPSLKAASVELDNIQKSMALDVIGAVTFGALSQGELNLAKEVALPTGLNTAELIQHLQNRKTSQEKLRAYFNEQIQFLDQGGTVAGFLRQQESNAPQQPAAAQPAGGDLSPAEQAELAELERQFGGQ